MSSGGDAFDKPGANCFASFSLGRSWYGHALMSLRPSSKCGSISSLPIEPASIQRLQSPPLPGPVGSHRAVPVVNFRQQVFHRLPVEVACNFPSNIKVHPRNKEVPSGSDELSDIPQAFFSVGWSHVAEKITCDHNVLRP